MTQHTVRVLKEGTLPANRLTAIPGKNTCLLSVEPPIQVGEMFSDYCVPHAANASLVVSTEQTTILWVVMEKFTQEPDEWGDRGIDGPTASDVVTCLRTALDDPSAQI